jgi:hypothetical protein
MPNIPAFDVAALRTRNLRLIVLDVAAGTLELRFADHVEIWQRVSPETARTASPRIVRTFNGDPYIGARREQEEG